MSFGLYMVGYVIFIIGVALGMHLLHIPQNWIVVAVIILFGLGILMGVGSTRRRDPSS
jgi:hypothetical protein